MSSEQLPQVEQALEEAERLRREGRYGEGIELLIEALKHGLEKAKIFFHLGNLYYDSGDLERAEYSFKRAIEHDPGHVNAHHNLSVVYRRQGRIGEYVRLRKRSLKVAGRHPEKVQLSEEQVHRARRLALRIFLSGIGFLALLALAVFLIIRF